MVLWSFLIGLVMLRTNCVEQPLFCPEPFKAYLKNCMECPPGQMPPSCAPCPDGFYGNNCTLHTNCKSGCWKSSGLCLHPGLGCTGGFSGPNCAKDYLTNTCKVGHSNADNNCQELCPLRCKDGKCENYNGKCLGGCKSGWFGENCDHKCPTGKVGRNCAHQCHCKRGCNQEDGSCSSVFFDRCESGYYGHTCQAYNFIRDFVNLTHPDTKLSPDVYESEYHIEYAFDGKWYTKSAATIETKSAILALSVVWNEPKKVKFVRLLTSGKGQEYILTGKSSVILGGTENCSLANKKRDYGNFYWLKYNCPWKNPHTQLSINLIPNGVEKIQLEIKELQLYECLPGYWGAECEYECQTHCSDFPLCNLDTGQCDQGCQEHWSSPIEGNITHCVKYTKNSVVAPGHAVVGHRMLVFIVFGLTSEFYQVMSSSGYSNMAQTGNRLTDVSHGQRWLSLQEARELGEMLGDSLGLALPVDLDFSEYNYSLPIVIHLVTVAILSEDMTHITMHPGLGNIAFEWRTNLTALVNITTQSLCFEDGAIIVGTARDREKIPIYSSKENIFLWIAYSLLKTCFSKDIKFKWALRKSFERYDEIFPGKKMNISTIFSSVPSLLIPAHSVQYEGLTMVECDIIIPGEYKSYFVQGFIYLSGDQLQSVTSLNVKLNEYTQIHHSVDQPLVLDASQSVESIMSSRNYSYLWFCEKSTTESCDLDLLAKSYTDNSLSFQNGTLTIPVGVLELNETYTFNVHVSLTESTRSQGSTSLKIYTSSSNQSDSEVTIKCEMNCANITVTDESLVLKCDISKLEFYGCKWDVMIGTLRNNTELYHFSPAEKFGKELFLDAEFFEPGQSYVFLVTAEDLQGDIFGTASKEILVNSPPTPGTCTVTPEKGYAMMTDFMVNCTGFEDPHQPVTYILKAMVRDAEIIIFSGENNTYIGKLPVGDLNNSTLQLRMEVLDQFKMTTDYTFTAMSKLPEANGTNILNVVESSIIINNKTEKDILNVLSIAASVTSSDYSSSISSNTTNNEEKRKQRNEIRKTILSVAEKIDLQSMETLAVITNLADTVISDSVEFSEDLKEIGVAFINNISQSLMTIPKSSTKQTRTVSKSILKSVGTLLTTIKNDSTETIRVNSSAVNMSKVRDLNMNLVSSLKSVANVLTSTVTIRDKPLKLQTKAMSVLVKKSYGADLGNFTLQESRPDEDQDNSTVEIQFPSSAVLFDAVASLTDPDYVCNTQIIVLDVNPYVWDSSAEKVSAPVVTDISIKTDTLEDIEIKRLSKPMSLAFSMDGDNNEGEVHQINVTLRYFPETNTSTVMSSSILRYILPTEEFLVIRIQPVDWNVTLKLYTSNNKEGITLYNLMQFGTQINTTKYFNSTQDSNLVYLLLNRTSDIRYMGLGIKESQAIDYIPFPDLIPHSGEVLATSSINISIRIQAASCVFFNTSTESWSSEGCQVSEDSSLDKMICLCSHLSVFSAGIFVVPNLVDPFGDARLFLTFFSNPIIVCAVITIWIIYLLLLTWARRVDREEFCKAGISELLDNNIEDKYIYIVGIVTGWWRHAGTTANVYMYLTGSKGHSAKHVLSNGIDTHFMSGKEDWFVMTTMADLGNLEKVTIWHDNMGSNPAWFLKQVIVRNIQTNQEWHFMFNNWLAVDRGMGLKTAIPALTPEDIKKNPLYQLSLKSSKDMRNNHLYVSIISCPPGSAFTRVQRLSVALSLLLLTMLTSLMFHGIPTDDPDDQFKQAGISISLSDLVIGIQSALIMFPINFVIMQLFTRIGTKPMKRLSNVRSWSSTNRNYDNLEKKSIKQITINNVEKMKENKKVIVKDTCDNIGKLEEIEEKIARNDVEIKEVDDFEVPWKHVQSISSNDLHEYNAMHKEFLPCKPGEEILGHADYPLSSRERIYNASVIERMRAGNIVKTSSNDGPTTAENKTICTDFNKESPSVMEKNFTSDRIGEVSFQNKQKLEVTKISASGVSLGEEDSKVSISSSSYYLQEDFISDYVNLVLEDSVQSIMKSSSSTDKQSSLLSINLSDFHSLPNSKDSLAKDENLDSIEKNKSFSQTQTLITRSLDLDRVVGENVNTSIANKTDSHGVDKFFSLSDNVSDDCSFCQEPSLDEASFWTVSTQNSEILSEKSSKDTFSDSVVDIDNDTRTEFRDIKDIELEVNKHTTDSDGEQKTSFRFPWWFVYIAWTLLMTISSVSSYFIMLYGLKYGYQKSVDWMVSFFTAFFQSALIMQPLKVFVFALLFTVVLKKPVEFENLHEKKDNTLRNDEEFLQKSIPVDKLMELTKQECTGIKNSLNQQAVNSLMRRLQLESEIAAILREIVMYFTFVAVVLFVVHGHNDIHTKFYATSAVENMLMKNGKPKFSKISTPSMMWKYIENVLVENIYNDVDLSTSFGITYLLGAARLRQKRIKKGECDYPKSMARLFYHADCVDDFWTGSEDDNAYNASWDVSGKETKSPTDQWTFQSAWKLKTIPYMGKLATYSGGGFVVELPAAKNDTVHMIKNLQNSGWIDRRTKVVFVEYTLYNPNVNMLSVIMNVFEFLNTGAIFPQYQIFTSTLYAYQNGLEIFVAVCESLFVLYVIYFTYHNVRKYCSEGRVKYFSDSWSYIEIVIIALSFSAIGLFFQKLISLNSILKDYLTNQKTNFTSFYTGVSWDFIFTYVMGFLIFFVILKVFKLCQFNPRTNLLTDTLTFSYKALISFMIIVVFIAVAFGHCGLLIFGSKLLDYSDFLITLMTLFNFSLGVSDYTGLESANRVLGPLFFFSFCFIVQYILLVIFVSILMMGYYCSLLKFKERRDIPVTWYLYNYIILLVGLGKQKDLKAL